jgi:hypothetical protein
MVSDKELFAFAINTIIEYWKSLNHQEKLTLVKKAGDLITGKEVEKLEVTPPDRVIQYLFSNPNEMKGKNV